MGRRAAAVVAVGAAVLALDGEPGADPLDEAPAGAGALRGLSKRHAPAAPTEIGAARKKPRNQIYPSPHRLRAARRFARSAPGEVSFAVIDPKGGLRGYGFREAYGSASASKALLLAAELRSLHASGLRLDPSTQDLLERMITYSDNDAADAIYARVSDTGIAAVAAGAQMNDLQTTGYWGGVQVDAADLARFYFRLNRNLVGPDRRFARNLLGRVIDSQRWGIPAAAGRRWQVWFKGGWRPGPYGQLTHQAGLLVDRRGQRIAIAILTDGQAGMSAGEAIIEGITRRLLAIKPRRFG